MTESSETSHRPLYDETRPVVCTIEAIDMPDHLAVLERLRQRATSIERTADGVVIRFPAGEETRADVRRFVDIEQQCCEFWGFEVGDDADGVALRWDGPPETAAMMDNLIAYVEGRAPIGALFGAPSNAAGSET